jgi:hypothetical protein
LGEILEQLGENSRTGIDIYPVTSLQAGMIASSLKDSFAYVAKMKWQLPSDFSISRLQNALDTLMQAHPILQARFMATSTGLFHVAKHGTRLRVQKCSVSSPELTDGFSLADSHWLRVLVVEEGGENRFLQILLHHALYDGWCLQQIVSDLFVRYQGMEIVATPPFQTFAEHAATVRLGSGVEDFWKHHLAGYSESPELNQSVAEDAGAVSKSSLNASLLRETSSKAGITVASLTKAAWALTLSQYLKQDTVVFANIVSGRDADVADIEKYNNLN